MLYQQIAFLRDRLLALKMGILQDVTDKDHISLCLLNSHYMDSDGKLWLFIKNTRKQIDAFARSRHIRFNFFAPGKSFHVEGVGVSIPLNNKEQSTALSAEKDDVFVVKVDISHMEYCELKTRPANKGSLSISYYKWLNFLQHNQSQKLLVVRRP